MFVKKFWNLDGDYPKGCRYGHRMEVGVQAEVLARFAIQALSEG